MDDTSLDACIQDARATAALYGFGADFFLHAFPVPGSQEVLELARRTDDLFDLADDREPAMAEFSSWVSSCLAPDADAAALQRDLAVDRTYLCRGTDPAGVLPPYESYYAADDRPNGSDAAALRTPSVSQAYAVEGVHLRDDEAERDDYLGTELAFVAHLAEREAAALEAGDMPEADRLSRAREAFERNHVGEWLARYCDAALPHAATSFSAGLLLVLKSLATEA